jgi:hypothetical protein
MIGRMMMSEGDDTRNIEIDGRRVEVATKRKRGPNKLPLMIGARPGQSTIKDLSLANYPTIRVYRQVKAFKRMDDMIAYMSLMFVREFMKLDIDPSRALTTRFFTKEITEEYVEYQAVSGYEGY